MFDGDGDQREVRIARAAREPRLRGGIPKRLPHGDIVDNAGAIRRRDTGVAARIGIGHIHARITCDIQHRLAAA